MGPYSTKSVDVLAYQVDPDVTRPEWIDALERDEIVTDAGSYLLVQTHTGERVPTRHRDWIVLAPDGRPVVMCHAVFEALFKAADAAA